MRIIVFFLLFLSAGASSEAYSDTVVFAQEDMCHIMDRGLDDALQKRFVEKRHSLPSTAVNVDNEELEEELEQLYAEHCPSTELRACSASTCGVAVANYIPKRYLCNCDAECDRFGDCCYNHAAACGNATAGRGRGRPWSCEENGFYMISSCPPARQQADLSTRLCPLAHTAELNPLHRQLLTLPVTDGVTGEVYRNYFCGLCNGVPEDSMHLWHIYVTCPQAVPEPPPDTLSDTQVLCLGLNDERCRVESYLLDGPSHLLRRCQPEAISDCAIPDETPQWLVNSCSSYTNYVFIQGLLFKNLHCAACNGVMSHMYTPYSYTWSWSEARDRINNSTRTYYIPEGIPPSEVWWRVLQLTGDVIRDIDNTTCQ